MATFTYIPDWGPSPDLQPRILQAKFGDGYDQRAPNGLNDLLPTWNLVFSHRTQAEALAIAAWFAANKAHVTAFDWTAPDGTVGKWVAEKWTPAKPEDYGSWSVTANLRMVPA